MASRGRAACDRIVEDLGLEPHPEGGYFRQCYRSEDKSGDLPERFDPSRGPMPFCTSIYYLLAAPDFSAFHRIKSDELWYFHEGTGMVVHEIGSGGELREHRLGSGGDYFCAVRARSWFSAEPHILDPAAAETDERPWALVSCAVSPGFDFRDFELAERAALADFFPKHAELVNRLARR